MRNQINKSINDIYVYSCVLLCLFLCTDLGSLHEGYDSQCCGGVVVPLDMTCCAGTQSYTTDSSKVCCGEEYVLRDRSLCCTDSDNNQKVSVAAVCTAVG